MKTIRDYDITVSVVRDGDDLQVRVDDQDTRDRVPPSLLLAISTACEDWLDATGWYVLTDNEQANEDEAAERLAELREDQKETVRAMHRLAGGKP